MIVSLSGIVFFWISSCFATLSLVRPISHPFSKESLFTRKNQFRMKQKISVPKVSKIHPVKKWVIQNEHSFSSSDWNKDHLDQSIPSFQSDEMVQKEMISAVKNRNVHSLRKLWEQHPNVNFGSFQNQAVKMSAAMGSLDILKFLKDKKGVNLWVNQNEPLCLAARNGHVPILQFYSQFPESDFGAHDNYAVRWASFYGHLDVLEFLLKQGNVDWTANDQEAVRWAAENQQIHVLRWMLLHVPDIDFSTQKNVILKRFSSDPGREIATLVSQWAARQRDVQTLMLCFRMGVNLGADHNLAARLAVEHRHIGVLEFLNGKPNVDFGDMDNQMIKTAISNGDTSIIRFLAEWAAEDASRLSTLHILFEDGINYSFVFSDIPFIAVQHEQLQVLEFLKGKPGIRFQDGNHIAFTLACGLGNLDIVKFLATLKDPLGRPILLPFARDNDAVIAAASNGHVHVLEYLATLPHVEFDSKNNMAAAVAAKNGHVAVLEFLERMPNVNLADGNNIALRNGAEFGHLSVLEFLDGKPGINFTV